MQPSDITESRWGIRVKQHGALLTSLPRTPRASHHVYDVIAALIHGHAPQGRVGILGFGFGGLAAPIWHLSPECHLEGVDLSSEGFAPFRTIAKNWPGTCDLEQVDAVDWLQKHRALHAVVDDLSISSENDLRKPPISWEVLPELALRHLARGGLYIGNMVRPATGTWKRAMQEIAKVFNESLLVTFQDYENKLLLAGEDLPTARELSRSVGRTLRQMKSRQIGRIRIRTY